MASFRTSFVFGPRCSAEPSQSLRIEQESCHKSRVLEDALVRWGPVIEPLALRHSIATHRYWARPQLPKGLSKDEARRFLSTFRLVAKMRARFPWGGAGVAGRREARRKRSR